VFSIQRGRGIVIYPSVQAVLSVWKHRIRRTTVPEPESWYLDNDFDLDKVLHGDIVRGSTILLAGPPATHKIPLGLSFLASGLQTHPEAKALLISLREDEAAMLRIIQTYPQFYSLLTPTQRLLSPRLKLLHYPPDYYTAERFLYWIRQHLEEFRQPSAVPCRVLFSNLNQLRNNSPMVQEETLLIAALIELFKKKHMTALFIGVGGDEKAGFGDTVDTILFTAQDATRGPDQVKLWVSHSGPCNADRTPKWLERQPLGDGYARLILLPERRGTSSRAPRKVRAVTA
jgi:hypothetical protein